MDDDKDDLIMYWLELEWQWRDSQVRLTDKQLLETFPEAKEFIPEKIAEWQTARRPIAAEIKNKLRLIKTTMSAQDQWFAKALVKHLDFPKVMKIDGHIARLKRLQMLAVNKRLPKGWITQEQIALAKDTPIENFISQFTILRKRGRTLTGLCPLHKEKTPSFTVYLNKNRWHCYGCNRGGDIINLVMELQGLTFLEAVRYLIN